MRRMMGMGESRKAFRRELEELLNRHSMENGSNTPEYVLGDFLAGCLDVFDRAVSIRSMYYGTEKAEEAVTVLMADRRNRGERREKAMAAHVRYDGPDGPEFYLCAVCGFSPLVRTSRYCQRCGRKIDWSGVCADHPAGDRPL
jgi:hypothetical protein